MVIHTRLVFISLKSIHSHIEIEMINKCLILVHSTIFRIDAIFVCTKMANYRHKLFDRPCCKAHKDFRFSFLISLTKETSLMSQNVLCAMFSMEKKNRVQNKSFYCNQHIFHKYLQVLLSIFQIKAPLHDLPLKH